MIYTKTLSSVVENLNAALYKNWTSGYMDDWCKWARQMSTTINNSVTTLNSVVSSVEEFEKKISDLEQKLAEKDALIARFTEKLLNDAAPVQLDLVKQDKSDGAL